ncbi:MAG: endoribonuclease L-PSP [Isosphaeraceae bacterium]
MELEQRRIGFSGNLHSPRYDRSREEPRIQRGQRDGVRFSQVHHAGIRHLFARARARTDAADERALARTLETLTHATERAGLNFEVVRQSVFTSDPRVAACLESEGLFKHGSGPVIDLFWQQPADGSLLVIESWGVASGEESVNVEHPVANLALVHQESMTTVHAACVARQIPGSGVHAQTLAGFEALRSLLAVGGVGFDRVIRTWLYLGEITGGDGATQRYKELNRARSDFFATCSLAPNRSLTADSQYAYPASTGIGALGHDLALGCLALVTDREDVQTIPLENPRQVAAHDYGAIYSPQSPKFSRAMAVEIGTDALILISGTASITRSETRHLGDAVAQTEETLTNIEALIAEANLARHGLPGFGCTLADLGVARVYIKREADYPAVREVCERRLGQVPVTYTVADVCRCQLLVEIEGIAFSKWALASP